MSKMSSELESLSHTQLLLLAFGEVNELSSLAEMNLPRDRVDAADRRITRLRQILRRLDVTHKKASTGRTCER